MPNPIRAFMTVAKGEMPFRGASDSNGGLPAVPECPLVLVSQFRGQEGDREGLERGRRRKNWEDTRVEWRLK